MRPSLKVARMASGPPSPSPPETPTTTSPSTKFSQKAAVNGDGNDNGHDNGEANQDGLPLPHSNKKSHRKSHHANIHPLGGTKFSYSRAPRPEEISPRSSESSEEESEPTASPPQSPLSEPPEVRKPVAQAAAAAAATSSASVTVEATFAIEELGNLDPDDSDVDLLVLRPSEIEYPDSECSGSPSRGPPDMDPSVVSDFKHLDPFYDSESDSPGGGGSGGGRNGGVDDDDEFQREVQRQRQERRIRRMKSGSISKRTISERGSDSDREDVLPWHDGGGGHDAETGTGTGTGGTASNTTRRLRRKTDRHSMQFSGQYFERIEELKEPNSDDEIILDDAEVFARELPYWTLMDVDSE